MSFKILNNLLSALAWTWCFHDGLFFNNHLYEIFLKNVLWAENEPDSYTPLQKTRPFSFFKKLIAFFFGLCLTRFSSFRYKYASSLELSVSSITSYAFSLA